MFFSVYYVSRIDISAWRGRKENLGMPVSVWKCFNFSSLFGKMMQCCVSSICWKKYEISQLLTHSYILWETEMFVSTRSYLVGIFVVYIHRVFPRLLWLWSPVYFDKIWCSPIPIKWIHLKLSVVKQIYMNPKPKKILIKHTDA